MGIEIKMNGNWERDLNRMVQGAVRDVADDYQKMFDRLGRQYKGRPVNEVKAARVVSARRDDLRCRTDRLRPTHQRGHPHQDAGRQVAEGLRRGVRGRSPRPRSTNAAEPRR